jgi:hypothetical protein
MDLEWVVQENLFNEDEFAHFTDQIRKSGAKLSIVKVIPFTTIMEPEILADGPKVVYGSTKLVRIAQERNWDPGAFFNENFSFEKWRENWGENLLNFDAEIMRFGDAKFDGIKFIRPVDDLKVFSGEIIEGERFSFWKERNLQHHTLLTEDQLIVVAEPKNIYSETRLFVVDGCVVTGSTYKIGYDVYRRPADPLAVSFGEEMIKIWQPHKAFVMDVCDTPSGMKILEINCINGSGFYASDTSKLVQALNDFYENNKKKDNKCQHSKVKI